MYYYYHDKERKLYDTASIQSMMDIWEHIIPEDDTETFIRIQLRPRYKVMKITREGYKRLITDATQNVNSKYPELTDDKRQNMIMRECYNIISRLTYDDRVSIGNSYPTPWQRC